MYTKNARLPFTITAKPAIFLYLFFAIVLCASAAGAAPIKFTILHTNDFHGNLQLSGSNPGAARVAQKIINVRTEVGAANVLLFDAGDEMQGTLLSNLLQGKPVIDVFNAMGYNAATFGNHDFDWGQEVLDNRTTQASYPFITANIVQNDTGSCDTAGWTLPAFADAPYQIITVGTDPDTVKVALIGVTTPETPSIANPTITAGLCFKDPADSILHYYDEIKIAGAQVIVVLSHLGYTDGGYGYGITVYGDQTLASRLNTAGKPVDLIIGGHTHTNLTTPTTVGSTKVVQAYYAGRRLGRADIKLVDNGTVSTAWTSLVDNTTSPEDPAIKALVASYALDPYYNALINQIIGYSQVDLVRNYNGDNMMGDFVDDAIYNTLNSDGVPENDVDMFFNNPGGLRADISSSIHPITLTYGLLFNVLPFGNQAIVGQMTGAQIIDLLNQSATLFKGALQPSHICYKFYRLSDALPGPQPYAWGAYDITVFDKETDSWIPLDPKKSYSVGTNEFLAPAGQDGFTPFKYMTNITYWGDMLDWLITGVAANYADNESGYNGPNGDGMLDGRITRDGNDNSSSIVPLTILHHNDSHGNLLKGSYVGYTQLATLIKQEKLHNPTRTLLLSAGDNIQGDAMMYYFRSAYTGHAADNATLAPELCINPLIAAFNEMLYDAMTVGNHEFNFGKDVFVGNLKQATFPVLQANLYDDGSYGLAEAGILPYTTMTTVTDNITVAIMGIGNHLVPNYELPGNIPGLTFSNPLTKAQALSSALRPDNDVVIALTHIGFTENPASVEVDTNVDTKLAATVTGLDAIIGGHSHTNPASGFGNYKYLPAIIADPDGKPVVTTQAYRYNNTLGEIVLGLKLKAGGGYEVVTRAGRYISVTTGTAEDAAIKAIITPYQTLLTAYNATVIGQTETPIDSLLAYTQETNGANLQADASVWKLAQEDIMADLYLAGANTNRKIAAAAAPGYPYDLTVADMFSLIPYENSLVVLNMNGPQLKAVLERAYRNYYYYKYVPGYGGYSYYTTCMLMPDAGNVITYYEDNSTLPDGNNVAGLAIKGMPVDFNDAATYYRVVTLNYLAQGSCNFNDSGTTIWPLDQITDTTQYYVRDAVIDYVKDNGTVNPAIDGRLSFISVPPSTTTTSTEPATTTTSTESSTTTTSTESSTTTTSTESSTTTTSTESSTTTTSAAPTSTTTTVPDSACTLKLIPKKMHKLLGTAEPVKVFILMSDKNSAFSAGAKPAWGSEAIKTMFTVPFGKRIIIALVLVNSFALEAGEITVTVGDCAGTIEVKAF